MILFSISKAVAYCVMFLLLLPVFAVNFVLLKPIEQIFKNDAGDDLPLISMIFYSENAGTKPLFSTASVAGALFGGVHCLVWHFSSPSHVEQIMWRAASLGIVGACAVSLMGTWTVNFFVNFDQDSTLISQLFHELTFPLSGFIMVRACAVYPVSRLMLLALAISSLRSLPSSALDAVNWVELVPHI